MNISLFHGLTLGDARISKVGVLGAPNVKTGSVRSDQFSVCSSLLSQRTSRLTSLSIMSILLMMFFVVSASNDFILLSI